jgi:DNA-binding IscR family transcriptional regulator
VRELLRSLGKAGLVATTEGRNGGVRIAKDAKEINLRSVYVAVEAQGPLKESPRQVYKSCPVSCAMKGLLRPIYQEVNQAMLKIFERKTISELTGGVPARPTPKRANNQRR